MPDPLAVGGERQRERDEVGHRAARQLLEDPERARLLVLRGLADVVDGRRGHARLDECGEQLLAFPCPRPLLEEREQLCPVAHAIGIRQEARVVRERGHAEDAAERGEELVVSGGDDHQAAVRGREHLVRGDLRERAPLAARHLARAQVADELIREQRQRRLVEGHVERASHAGPLAVVQRREDAERGPDAGAEVDQRDTDAYRRPVVLAGDAHDPGGGLHQRVVAGLIAQRPRRPERADRAVDESRVARAHRVRAEAALLRRARAQALHEHVGAVGEPQKRLEPARVAEIERERPLAGVRRQEHRALALPERRPPGARVVAAGRLDLDDVGAERREQLRRGRPGERRGHVDDERPLERAQRCAHAGRARMSAGLCASVSITAAA